MKATLALGWRNLWRNRRRTLVSMVAIGVGLVLVVLYSGLLAGVLGEARAQLDNGGLGHVEVSARGYRPRHDVARVLRDEAALGRLPVPPGAEVGTRVLARGLATSARGNEPVQVFGVDWGDETRLSAHLRDVRRGALPATDDARGVLVGDVLAERLGLQPGSKLRLVVQRADAEMGAGLFRVRGVFHSIAPAIGQRHVYLSQAAARELLGLEGGVHQVVVQLEDAGQADAVAAQVRAALGDGAEVVTWGELLPVLKRLEGFMDAVVYAIGLFVYLLVGLGVANTMMMSVLERTREFGVLMALGTSPRRVMAGVLAESFWMATLATAGGALVGSLVTWYLSREGLHFSGIGESFQVEGATVASVMRTKFVPLDVLRAAGFVYAMALVVGLVPARRITRLWPAEALRRT